jgi:lipopolysaccharide export system permease protein
MGVLYLFILPDLLFYTIPLAFFIGGVTTFNKLSFDSEMVVIFSLGVPPKFIMRKLFGFGVTVTALLLFVSIVMIPHTKQMYKEFINIKKQNAILNIEPTDFGEKFGGWSIFIEDMKETSTGKIYTNVALFYQDGDKEERFIVAESAKIEKNIGVVQLVLKNGSLFSYRIDNISEVYFEEMRINDLNSMNRDDYMDTLEYLEYSLQNKKRRVKLIVNIALSLFPLATIFLIMAIGIQNMRHGKGVINLFIGLSIAIYYFAIFSLSKPLDFWIIGLLVPSWFVGTYFIYKQKILSRY